MEADALETVGGAAMTRSAKPDRAPRFPLISPAELAQPVEPVEFLIDGLWPAGSFGPWGGPKKSLKTHCASLAAIAVAAGVPAMGHWPVRHARPVIYYGGEGGRDLHARRFQRIAREVYGLDLEDLPLYLVTGVGPFDTKEFRQELEEHCEEIEPGLVVLDSLYNYHPAGIEVGNLYDRGRVLSDLSHPLAEAGVALWILDHFNKNGAGLDLDRLAQAGMAAWADSWVLLDHRSTPDVAEGRFALRAEVGSRQWGGAGWDIDLDIGRFDLEQGTHASPIKVSVERSGSGASAPSGRERLLTREDVMREIVTAVRTRPGRTKNLYISDLVAEFRTSKARVADAWEVLEEDRLLVSAKVPVDEGGRSVSRDVWEVGDGRVRRGQLGRQGELGGELLGEPAPRSGKAPSRREGRT